MDVVRSENVLLCNSGEVLGRWMGEFVGRGLEDFQSGESGGVNGKF